ncbi:hypothetical protein M5K25_023799 [Dendrobium thyrsiflorum]|uniref:Uncharacterized protein n=1 Tax=Dendrobium thyrsiflorum TaxID=117978 RepID=A0ABD0U0Q0_DENTH
MFAHRHEAAPAGEAAEDPKQEEKKRRGEGRDSSSTTAGVPPNRHLTPEFCRTTARHRSYSRLLIEVRLQFMIRFQPNG